jgi:hypothetical protein
LSNHDLPEQFLYCRPEIAGRAITSIGFDDLGHGAGSISNRAGSATT